jgi:hypothetical protein
MADSPEIQAAVKRYKQALSKYDTVHTQTNDPAQHKAAEDEVHNSLSSLGELKAKAAKSAPTGLAGQGQPKSAWEMLTGR